MNPKAFSTRIIAFTACIFAVPLLAVSQTPRTSGLYLTAADYLNGKLEFRGDCGSKAHKLAVHDVWNKPYVDIKHGSERHRFSKSDLFGFRACDGRDYRFVSNVEYEILEAKELYIYAHDIWVNQGRTNRTVREYYFSVGVSGQIQQLTLQNLKQAFPENHRFHDWLDATFGTSQDLAAYDEFHKMFKVNRLLIASRNADAETICCPKQKNSLPRAANSCCAISQFSTEN